MPARLLIRFAKRKDGRYVLSCVRQDGRVTWQGNGWTNACRLLLNSNEFMFVN